MRPSALRIPNIQGENILNMTSGGVETNNIVCLCHNWGSLLLLVFTKLEMVPSNCNTHLHPGGIWQVMVHDMSQLSKLRGQERILESLPFVRERRMTAV